MRIDQFNYEKIDYNVYNRRIDALFSNEKLIEFGIAKNNLGYTTYGYELSEIVIGNGKKDLYIVGGTHGSEVIGVDFVTQLISYVPNLNAYDPNLITLHFIPLQNPEGFDITTQTLKGIDDADFQKESFDYYLRYRIDNLVNAYLGFLNERFKNFFGVLITPKVFIDIIKESFTSSQWANLCDEQRAIPDMVKLEQLVMNLGNYSDFITMRNEILLKSERLKYDSDHPYFSSALTRIINAIFSEEIIEMINRKNEIEINRNAGSRLYQERFAQSGIKGTVSDKLAEDVGLAYDEYGIPLGSQVKFDSTGLGINLNKNRPENPGIEVQKNGDVVYGSTPSNNIRDNVFGPIGMPTTNPNSFSYAYENIVLMKLLEKSAKKGRLVGTLLYHGTGGLVYSKPYQGSDIVTPEFMAYNDILSDSYKEKTGYKQIENAENTGFGDYLRQTYPGVLLIELSKMGGNPIGPYGDMDNIYRVFNDNLHAINEILRKCNDDFHKNR